MGSGIPDLKKLLAILLLLAFTVQCFSNFIIVLGFYANQRYFAATVCENRFKPILHCDGKCVLAKKLKQEEKKNDQNPERKQEHKTEIIFSATSTIQAVCFPPASRIFHPRNSPEKLTLHYREIFHPPVA